MLDLIYSILVPHFATKTFCLNYAEDGESFDAVCLFDNRYEGEEFDALMDVSYFNLLGFTLFPRNKSDTFRVFEKSDILVL